MDEATKELLGSNIIGAIQVLDEMVCSGTHVDGSTDPGTVHLTFPPVGKATKLFEDQEAMSHVKHFLMAKYNASEVYAHASNCQCGYVMYRHTLIA